MWLACMARLTELLTTLIESAGRTAQPLDRTMLQQIGWLCAHVWGYISEPHATVIPPYI